MICAWNGRQRIKRHEDKSPLGRTKIDGLCIKQISYKDKLHGDTANLL